MKSYVKNISANLGWLLLAGVYFLAISAWFAQIGSLSNITPSNLFPLLGLLAWLTMWTHYVMAARDVYSQADLGGKYYWVITRALVLLMILLHPFILAWTQWSDAGLLPPGSFYSYVADGLKVYIFTGTLALLIFLSFEVFKRFKKSGWVIRNSRWIELSQIVAMILVFFHAIQLGSIFSGDWLVLAWVTLGAALLPCFGLVLASSFGLLSEDQKPIQPN